MLWKPNSFEKPGQKLAEFLLAGLEKLTPDWICRVVVEYRDIVVIEAWRSSVNLHLRLIGLNSYSVSPYTDPSVRLSKRCVIGTGLLKFRDCQPLDVLLGV